MRRNRASFLNRNQSNSLTIKMNFHLFLLALLPVLLTYHGHLASAQKIKLGAGGLNATLSLDKPDNETMEALREKCLANFPEFKQEPMDSELTTTEVPTTVANLDDEVTTELPPENSTDVSTEAPNNSTESDDNQITTTISDQITTPTPDQITTTIPDQITTTIAPDDPDATKNETEQTTTPITTSTPPSTTTPPTISPRRGKQLDIPDANQIREPIPSASIDALVQLIKDLTKKIENLESTQRNLRDNIGELQKKLENSPQMLQQKEATTDLVAGDPNLAAEKWKDLAQNVSSPDELGNITSNIVEEAFDQGAPPTSVMDFVDKLPSPEVQESAYNTVSDKLNSSERAQEELYWKDMSPYCQQAAQSIGPNNPSTIKMYNVQNQVRLNAARPIAQTARNIQSQEYQPAVFNWLTMCRDIPDSPPQLETNMKRMMLRTYDGNPVNLPFAFHFILILPHNQGHFKQVAYKCLTQEMKANGHYYNPNYQQQTQNSQSLQRYPSS